MAEAAGIFLPHLFELIQLSMAFLFLACPANVKNIRQIPYLLYTASCFILLFLTGNSIIFQLLFFTLLLMLFGIFEAKLPVKTAFLLAFLAVEILVLCNGITESVTGALTPFFLGLPFQASGLLLVSAGGLLSALLTFLCFTIIYRFLSQIWSRLHGTGAVLCPLALTFLANQYIHTVFYGNNLFQLQIFLFSWKAHFGLTVLRALGTACVLSLICLYLNLNLNLNFHIKYSALERQCRLQKQYVEESRQRYELTRGLRHDMRNHLLILQSLLEHRHFEQAAAYIGDLDIHSQRLSFPFRTGRPVLDVLLENKAALAGQNGIPINCMLVIPISCGVKDVDLCIILSNALDNAIRACENSGAFSFARAKNTGGTKQSKPYISLAGHMQGNLLLIEIKNSFWGTPRFEIGTGLKNIQETVGRYGGTMEIRTEKGCFCLRVLLDITR